MIVKICGIQNKDTLFCCEKNNVDFFGMIFYSNSPRNISIEKAREIQELSKNLNINGVGVFVNSELESVKNVIQNLDLKFIQLHGAEDYQYINDIKKTGVKIIKNIGIKNKSDLKKIEIYNNADFFLFDYKPEIDELPGGNAKSFDWNILKSLSIDKPWFLSGGINLKNIELIKLQIDPFGVDLSSGAEKKLGIKDNQIINNFMRKLNYA